jgi:hypothetical protein
MNIICIDLRMFNHVKLQELCDLHSLRYEAIWENKKQGFAKLWIDTDKMQIIAFNTKKNHNIQFTDEYCDFLLSYVPVDLIKSENKLLNLDDILDKISKYGISSLTLDERDFLGKVK